MKRIVVQVPIFQDTISEGTEQFRASLSLVESNGIIVTLSPEQVTVNITDDEGISIMNRVLYADTVHHYQREVFELKPHNIITNFMHNCAASIVHGHRIIECIQQPSC